MCTLNVSDTIVFLSYELTAGENPAYPITNQSAYYIEGQKALFSFLIISIGIIKVREVGGSYFL